MALREAAGRALGGRSPSGADAARLPGYARAIGVVGAAVGALTFVWVAAARPEVGGAAERWAYFLSELQARRARCARALRRRRAARLADAPRARRATASSSLLFWTWSCTAHSRRS